MLLPVWVWTIYPVGLLAYWSQVAEKSFVTSNFEPEIHTKAAKHCEIL